MDPLAAAAAWTAITRGGLSFLAFVRDHVKDSGVISATFDADGVRTAGDLISIRRFPLVLDTELTQAWAYEVEPMEGYTFVPLAVQPDAVLQFEFGALPGEDVPAVRTTRFFRWIPPVLPGVLYTTDGVRPNLSVDFMVVGYRPEALRRYLAGE